LPGGGGRRRGRRQRKFLGGREAGRAAGAAAPGTNFLALIQTGFAYAEIAAMEIGEVRFWLNEVNAYFSDSGE